MRHRSMPVIVSLIMLLMACGLPMSAGAASNVATHNDRVDVTLDNGARLQFALHKGMLLGLSHASVQGMQLTSDETVQRPYIAQEWFDDKAIGLLMKFRSAEVQGDAVEITVEVLKTQEDEAFRTLFVYAADKEAALGEGITDEIRKLRGEAQAARKVLDQLVAKHPDHVKAMEAINALKERIADPKSKADQKSAASKLKKSQRQLSKLEQKLLPGIIESSDEAKAAQAKVDALEEAVIKRGLEIGKVHRDFYRFAHTRLPAEVCTIEFQKGLVDRFLNKTKSGGTLTWIIKPHTANIAGWQWVGWEQHYRLNLGKDMRVNKVRQLGTWEIGGNLDGLNLINLRYRGLGRLEQPLSTDSNGGVEQAFSTTEVIPGAVGGGYAVSPKLPVPNDKKLSDRGYALQHRTGAWIAHMARGAGHGFVDFQYRDDAAFASYYVRQGSLRALTETFPGDKVLSQTDDEYFALTTKQETTPQRLVALVSKDKPLGAWETRTRWQEVDEYVREMVSNELGFVRREVMPGVGKLYDAGWSQHFKHLAESRVAELAKDGVRFIAVHNPGWINGRYQGPEGPPRTGGGVCNIYDWTPTQDMVQPWKDFQKACAQNEVAYFPWIGQTVWREAPFVQRIGEDKKHWSLNGPFDKHGPGYGYENCKGNINDPAFRRAFTAQWEALRKDYGYQGVWADSFQNLFMSQLNWANGTGESLQRSWWEMIAGWTQKGVAWMAESHSFPGMSCSIEVHGWDDQPWLMGDVFRWYRGNEQSHFNAEQLERNLFRIMANKGWTAPDLSYNKPLDKAMPFFGKHAHDYLAALPLMRRSYVLPDNKGMLWLSYESNALGVWFPFEDSKLPEGVKAMPVRGKDDETISKTGAKIKAQHTYRVTGDDLLKRFGLRQPPLKDPRLGREYKPATYAWPEWATAKQSAAR